MKVYTVIVMTDGRQRAKSTVPLVCLAVAGCLTVALALTGLCQGSNLHFERALQHEFAGDTQAAISEYRQGLAADPGSVDGHTKLGVLLLEEDGDLDGAISELVTALSIDPRSRFSQMYLDEAVDRRNSSGPDNIARGNDFYRSGQMSRASAAYRIAIFVDPGNADAHNSLAWTLYRAGQLDEALREVKEALRLRADEPEFVNSLACILYDRGDLDGAMAMWRKAIARSKKANAADLYGLALGFLSRGDRKEAAESFKQAVKADPNYMDVAYLRDKVGMSVHALASHDQLLLLGGSKEKPPE